MKKMLLGRVCALLALLFVLTALPLPAFAQTVTIEPRTFLRPIEQVVDTADIPAGFTPLYGPEDLQEIANDPSGSFILMNDIAVGGNEILQRVTFSGVLEGNGHSLKALDMDYGQSAGRLYTTGLFSTLNGATVRNLMVQGSLFLNEGANTGGQGQVGGLAGYVCGKTQVYNCVVNVDITCHSSMIDVFGLETTGCYGGLIGCMDASAGATVSYCRNLGDLEVTDTAGGIVGYLAASSGSANQTDIIYACLNTGSVYTRMENAGGIVGLASNNTGSGDANFLISVCANEGEIVGCWNVGGILGASDDRAAGTVTINNCLNAGKIVGTDGPVVCVGGIAGKGECYIFSCVNAGSFIANVPSGIHTTVSECQMYDCYHLDNVQGAIHQADATIVAGNPLTAEQMTVRENFPALDFESIWVLEKGMKYPVPREVLIRNKWIVYSADAEESDFADLRGLIDRENAIEAIMNSYEFTEEELQGIIICFAEGYGEYPGGGNNNDRSSALCVVWENGEIIFTADNCSTYPDYPTNPGENGGKAMPTVIDGKYNATATNHLRSKSGFNYPALKVQNPYLCRIKYEGYYTEVMDGSTINIHSKSTESLGLNSQGCTVVGTAQTRTGPNNTTSLSASNEYCRFAYMVGFAADADRDGRAEIKSGIEHIPTSCTVVYNRSHGYDNVPEFKANFDADYKNRTEEIQVILGRK